MAPSALSYVILT